MPVGWNRQRPAALLQLGLCLGVSNSTAMLAKPEALAFPVGGGEMGALIRAFDWSRTPLGPIAGWPQSLKTAVDIVLRSPVPLVMLWGRDGIMIYNDAYSVFAGGRHPQLLGSKVLEGWPEVADLNRRVMEVGLRGETLSFRDEHLVLYRPGRPAGRLGRSRLQPPARRERHSRPACSRSWSRRPSGCAPSRRCATARRSSAPSPPPCRTTSGRRRRTASSIGSTSRCSSTPGASRAGARRATAGARSCIPTTSTARSRPGKRRWRAARSTRSSFACAAATASIAGIWRAPCRSATRPARSVRWIGTNTDIDDQDPGRARLA